MTAFCSTSPAPVAGALTYDDPGVPFLRQATPFQRSAATKLLNFDVRRTGVARALLELLPPLACSRDAAAALSVHSAFPLWRLR